MLMLVALVGGTAVVGTTGVASAKGSAKVNEDGGKNDFDLQDRSEGGERNAPRLRQRVPDHNDKSPIVDRAR